MATEYTLTAGQLWGLTQVFALTSAQNDVELSRRLNLIQMLDFTAEERELIELAEIPGPLGQPDQFTFKGNVELARSFTQGQRKKIVDTALQGMPFAPNMKWFQTWVLPGIQALGYKLPNPNWPEDGDE